MRIAAGVLDALAVERAVPSEVPVDPGGPLEQPVCDHLGRALHQRYPDRGWRVSRGTVITGFDQYAHLTLVCSGSDDAVMASCTVIDRAKPVNARRR